MWGIDESKKIICSLCNRVAIKLVPLYDHDHKKELQQCCCDCKKKIKKGIKIERYTRREEK